MFWRCYIDNDKNFKNNLNDNRKIAEEVEDFAFELFLGILSSEKGIILDSKNQSDIFQEIENSVRFNLH